MWTDERARAEEVVARTCISVVLYSAGGEYRTAEQSTRKVSPVAFPKLSITPHAHTVGAGGLKTSASSGPTSSICTLNQGARRPHFMTGNQRDSASASWSWPITVIKMRLAITVTIEIVPVDSTEARKPVV